MMQERVTSEERLLKITQNPIETKHNFFADVKKSLGAGFSFKKLWMILQHGEFKSPLSLKIVHRLLLIGSIGITFISTIIFIKGHNDFEKRFKKLITIVQADLREEGKDIVSPLKLTELVKTDKRKNIFTALLVKPENTEAHPAEQLVSSLKLVGILWSANPQAMIEDTVANKTLLVGLDEMAGDFKIINILEDKVILGKDDQQWELK